MSPVGTGSVRRGPVTEATFAMPATADPVPVIGVSLGRLITSWESAVLAAGAADVTQDVLKAAVLERHGRNGNVGRGWVISRMTIADGIIDLQEAKR